MLKNEKRPGHKKTKVGWVPKDWECSTFGETFQIQLGKMLNKQASAGTSQQPYLTNINVRWGSFDVSIIRTMSFSETEKAKFALKQGDLLVCEGGEIGRCAVWDEEIKPCYYQKALHRLRAKKESVEVRFAMHFLHQAFTSSRVHGLVGETSFAHFTKERFVDFPISVPPYPEQIAIAEVLECWDKAVRTLTLKIDKKRQAQKQLMNRLLSGKQRLPGFLKRWKDVRLGKLGEFSKGAGISKEELSPKGVPCIRYGEIYTVHNFVLKEFHSFISPSLASISARIRKNDLLFAGSGETAEEIGKSIAYMGEDEAYAGGDVILLSVNPAKGRADFISYYLNTIGRRELNKLGQGQSVVHIYPKNLAKVNLVLPPLEEQHAIATVLSASGKEIEALESKLALFKDQKKYLLNNLVTGTIRLPQFKKTLT